MTTRLEAAWSRVRPAPAPYQRWIDADAVSAVFRDSQAARALSDMGLSMPDGRFEAFDVWNLALLSGTRRTRPELEMAYTARLFSEASVSNVSDVLLSASATCVRGCSAGSWGTPTIVEGVSWQVDSDATGSRVWTGEHQLRAEVGSIGSARLRTTWSTIVDRFDFHYTQPELALDAALTLDRGVGDCTAISVLLSKLLARAGLRVRIRSGYLLGGLNSRPHQLVEAVDDDGMFKAMDATLAILAKGHLPSWLRDCCCGSRPARVLLDPPGAAQTVPHSCPDGHEADAVLELAVRSSA